MNQSNIHATLHAVSIGGSNNPTVTFSVAIQFYLSDSGDGGIADAIFAGAPEVRNVMDRRGGRTSQVEVTVSAEEVFEGLQPHAFKLWGLDEASRRVEAEPLIMTNSATIRGKAKVKVVFGDEDNVAASIVLPIKAPAAEVPDLTIRQIGAQLHGECWIDLVKLQTDLMDAIDPGEPGDPVKRAKKKRESAQKDKGPELPALRKPESRDGSKPEEVKAAPPGELLPGPVAVILHSVPDMPLGLARVLEQAVDPTKARELIAKVNGGTTVEIGRFASRSADRLIDEIGKAGGKALRAEMPASRFAGLTEDEVNEQIRSLDGIALRDVLTEMGVQTRATNEETLRKKIVEAATSA